MSNTEGDLKAEKSKSALATLKAEGSWHYQKKKYKKAIDTFTAALALNPTDKNCFIDRCKCYMMTGQYEKALKDAESSLKGDKAFYEGLYQKAEALYRMGEFEFALVFYHRGQKLRPQREEIRLGIQKAQEAIEKAIGSPSSVKLEIKGDLPFFKKDEDGTSPIAVIHDLTKERKQPTAKNIPRDEKTKKQLLGEFYNDKKFLEDLMKDEDLVKSWTTDGERVQDVFQSCLAGIDNLTVYAQEGKGKQRKGSQPRHSGPCEPAQFLLKSFDEIDEELTCGNANGSLKKAKEVMKVVKSWSETEAPNKKEALGRLHSCIGSALVDLEDTDKALEHHQKDLELAIHCKLPEATSRALENIGRVYAQTGQFARAIQFWEKKIPFAHGAKEKTWLFYEIGRCYLELNRHKEARDFGVRSVAAADEITQETWQINVHLLVAQSEYRLGNIESCVSHFETALTHAKHQEEDSATNAIQQVPSPLSSSSLCWFSL
ncbi:outer dynein arm-docking complex subunit 4 isoform X1 [Brachyistius frenatus]|uniref:outer dynein arm-docking complex subunit 4 isoform X1 n=1 Tax=Brachyistius frenatus TaxID=100188 RepID=UPI0037E8520C